MFDTYKKLIVPRWHIFVHTSNMNHWYFDPFYPTKHAYDNRMFKTAKSIKEIIQLVESAKIRVRGQFVLKGYSIDYPKIHGLLKFEANNCMYVDFNNSMELLDFINSIEWKEEKVDRIIFYNIGYFHK